MQQTLFELIATRQIPSFIIWEDDEFCAFLDINPVAKGHTLVVSKKNIGDYIFELSDNQLTKLTLASKKVAELLKKKIKCDRIVMVVEGFEVPHVHVKLIPATKGFNVYNAEKIKEASPEELEKVQKHILSD